MPGELNDVRDKSYSKGKEKIISEIKSLQKQAGFNRGPPQQTYY